VTSPLPASGGGLERPATDGAQGLRLRFIIISGLSGAGKSYAIKCFEDMGYFCVDNLPAALIPTFAELCAHSTRHIDRIALGADVRAGEYLSPLAEVLSQLRGRGDETEVLFLEASEDALVRRYHETRRRHPLGGTVLEGIRRERALLADLRELADRVVDTSHLTVHQLKETLVELYGKRDGRTGLSVNLVSFGYKYGVPHDADLVFDCRFLPNPFFVPELKVMDGRAPAVREFVISHGESREFLARIQDLLGYLLPRYQQEGKAYVTIAVGCTGGRHRSVALVEELRPFIEGQELAASVMHRDVDRDA
jgi:UPF0042 nucleotide-binding protein